MIAGLAGMTAGIALDSECSAETGGPLTAKQALQRLVDGNKRFVQGKTKHAHRGADWRRQLVAGQAPFACLLGCSDSRVPIELVFDQGFGDIFVVRIAGNIASKSAIGSVEYAVAHLHTPLVVVLGHEECGAITATLKWHEHPTKEPAGLETLLSMVEPDLPKVLPGATEKERISAAVEANVRAAMNQLSSLVEAKQALVDKRVALVGGIYDIETGKVNLLQPSIGLS
jgi:carbonic anhydrase